MRSRSRAATVAALLLLPALGLGSGAPAPALLAGAEPATGTATDGDLATTATTTGVTTTGTTSGTRTIAVTAAQRPGHTPVPATDGLRELRSAATTTVDRGGAVRSVTAPAGRALKLPLGVDAGAGPDTVAKAFVGRYAQTMGIPSGNTTKQLSSSTLPGGDTVVRFNQYASGLPVLGGQVTVTVTGTGTVRAAAAEAAGKRPVATTARVSASAARRSAVTAAAAKLDLPAGTLHAGKAALWLFDPALFADPVAPGATTGRSATQLRPVWRITVFPAGTDTGTGVAEVLIDATTGGTTLVIENEKQAKSRLICDLKNASVDLNDRTQYACDDITGGPAVVRREGGAASSVADVNQAYDNMGVTYDFYKTNFGRDSFDDRGSTIRATVRACDPYYECPYQNAFWEGTQFVFGAGFAVADDVVAHEFTHGVTEHTSQLLYWQQSGAINEALSDIMGQFVDLAHGNEDSSTNRWRLGEDLSIGAIRDMRDPTLYYQPDSYTSPYFYRGTIDNGGVHTNSGVANKAAYLLADGGTFNGQTVAALGLTKSAQLWYRVMNQLSSGANFQDLGVTLSSGCRQLVGYQGFTTTDCTQVDKAVVATGMNLAQSTNSNGAAEAALCASTDQPTSDIFYDDFEKSGAARWVSSAPGYFLRIPALAVPGSSYDFNYSYAASGQGAIEGWTQPGETGHNQTMTMARGVSIPASGSTYLWFAHSMIKDSAGAGVVQINTGSGWANLTTAATGIVPSGGSFTALSRGYGSTRFDLSSYAGQTVKIRYLINSPSNSYVDWFIDDVRIYQCATQPGQPRNLAGARSTGLDQATVSWDAPAYTGSGIAQYEVTISPAPANGVQTVLTTSGSYTFTGLDPTRVYQIAVRVLATDGSYGVAATTTLPIGSASGCTTVIDPRTGRPHQTCPSSGGR